MLLAKNILSVLESENILSTFSHFNVLPNKLQIQNFECSSKKTNVHFLLGRKSI